MRTQNEIKQVGAGAAGSISVTVKLPSSPLFLYSLVAGFDYTEWGNIKFTLTPKKGTGVDLYFHTGISVPSPGGDHASIVSWQGKKYIDGKEWNLKVVGISNHTASDGLYVHGNYEVIE